MLLLAVAFMASIASAQQLGASLYIAPLQENPRVGSNFTVTLKADSLAESINALKGHLVYNNDKLEIINVSKIGSIVNLWVEEPRFSNVQGTLSFQGGIPNPGFIGNGGVVLHVIFRAKAPGVTRVAWDGGEILANDGKGTNILTALQNLDFVIESAGAKGSSGQYFLMGANVSFLAIFVLIGLFFGARFILRWHDTKFHQNGPFNPRHP